MINQTLNNRYKIKSLLGEGGMGEVYLAADKTTGRQVAVKILARHMEAHPEALERFRREAETLRRLNHPNIVKFIDAFEHKKQFVIVMEYVAGGSLFKLLKRGPMPIGFVLRIALELCDALIRSHHLSVIHRDLKPENILLEKDGAPKLADFGVARLNELTRMTRSGTQVGTPYYMSPEAWEGKTLDAQADIWSFGVILFEMLTGHVPFDGDTPLAVMNKVYTAPPPDLNELRADLPTDMVKVISRMLTRDKRERYQTMREVAVDLERVQLAVNSLPAEEDGGFSREIAEMISEQKNAEYLENDQRSGEELVEKPGAKKEIKRFRRGAKALRVIYSAIGMAGLFYILWISLPYAAFLSSRSASEQAAISSSPGVRIKNADFDSSHLLMNGMFIELEIETPDSLKNQPCQVIVYVRHADDTHLIATRNLANIISPFIAENGEVSVYANFTPTHNSSNWSIGLFLPYLAIEAGDLPDGNSFLELYAEVHFLENNRVIMRSSSVPFTYTR